MLRWWLGILSFPILLFLGVTGPAVAADRAALVIGNSAYPTAALRNPVNDARAMDRVLRDLGFDVIRVENATKQEIERAIGQFSRKLTADTVGVVYYAGHGVQVNGRNYLVPVDARIELETSVRLEAVDVDAVLDQMAAAKNKINILILDACRNNPFERRFRGTSGGLASIDAPAGTLIAYATAPGKVAADGEGDNGLYTSELINAMVVPGLSIESVFKQVRLGVIKRSKSMQTPWESSSLTGDFSFKPPSAAVAPPFPAAEALAKGDAESRVANYADAMRWFQQASDQGNITAQLNIGTLYFNGRGVKQDYAEAMRWYRKAAEKGDAKAQYNIAVLYYKGSGVKQDYVEGMRWYKLAAEQGLAHAQVAIGISYDQGQGVKQEYFEAMRWYKLAAEQGLASAQSAIGALYHDGLGVKQDYAEAMRWYKLAAEQGHANAQLNIGTLYKNGRGVKQDYAEAMRWYQKAEAKGNVAARGMIDSLEKESRSTPTIRGSGSFMERPTEKPLRP